MPGMLGVDVGVAVFIIIGVLIGALVADTVGVTAIAGVSLIDIWVTVGQGVKVA
jgi:hypothetical protein